MMTRPEIVQSFGRNQANDDLIFEKDMVWLQALLGRVPRGCNVLCSGDPGIGKSTLLQQAALSTAACGEQVLYLSNEQVAETIYSRMGVLASSLGQTKAKRALSNLTVVDDLVDPSLLPSLLSRHIIGPGKHRGTSFVAIDSLHGSGPAAHDRKYWSAIYEYLKNGASAGITTFGLCHMTKDNRIAGPRTLEHQVDVTLLMRPGIGCRTLVVPKNRNGASVVDPFAVAFCPTSTRLIPSKLSTSSTASILTVGHSALVPVEASIGVPKYERGYLKVCGLPRQDVDAIITVCETCISDAHLVRGLGVIIRGTADVRYQRDHNLAIAISLLAAINRVEVSPTTIAVGDVSLRGYVSAPSELMIANLEAMVAAGELPDEVQVLTGPGLDKSHPIRKKLHLIEASTLPEAWKWSQS